MSKLLKMLALMALACSAGISSAEQYHGFVKDPYYLILGGKEVSPQDFAAEPLKYMRSAAAYTILRDHVAQVVGRPMSDEAFRSLLVSDDVRVVECVGRIATDGITDEGKVGRHERACYSKEHLLEVKVSGGWMKLLSLGCYNPVEGERPPPPPPVSGACGSRAKAYSHDATSWPEGKFCSSGTPSPTSIIFPETGKTTAWTCEGSGGGQPDLCTAERAEPPSKVSKAPPKCGMTQTTTYTRSPPIATRLEPLFLNGACGPIYMPGINTYVPPSTTKTTTYQPVCVD